MSIDVAWLVSVEATVLRMASVSLKRVAVVPMPPVLCSISGATALAG
jgi:hypothetical protein